MKWSRVALLLALLVVFVAAGALLFRHSTDDNPALGLVTTEYRWGKPRFVLLDVNRDGVTDSRARYSGAGYLSPHDVPSELWESTQCDGQFDVHAVLDSTGEVLILELDDNRDGVYDTTAEGARAQASWDEVAQRRDCTDSPAPSGR